MTCGARNEYNDVCGETYTCPSCRSGDEADRLCARIAELERVLKVVESILSDDIKLRRLEAPIKIDERMTWKENDRISEQRTVDALAEIKSVLGKGE